MEGMIELPANTDLVKLVKEVYDLSLPQGLGFLHFKPKPMSDDEAKEIVRRGEESNFGISMDYVNGRSCKFYVTNRDGKMFIARRWYDHSESSVRELCKRMDIQYPEDQAA